MSVYNLWDKETKEAVLKSSLSSEWNFNSPIATPRSASPTHNSKVGEQIFNNYIDLIHSKSDLSTNAKQTETLDRPFDFFDDEEFAFGINILNNNVACVGDNKTKLIQMAQEPWPDNVKLFQPYEVEQILLPDNASCLAVQAFLKMCNLPFEVEMRWNAEFMSPSGRVPFIKCGAFVVSELEPIVQFAANKGVSLCSRLSMEEKAEMRAYMSLITNVLVNAELYISWLDEETFSSVTRARNSSVYPWPLGWLQTRAKRAAVAKRLRALHWHDKTLDQVLADVEQCCNSLSQRLGERDYFFGTPTPLDALIYGHVRALLAASGPRAALMIKPITSALLRHTVRMSNLTVMKMTPQEEYLVSQAFQVCARRRLSPDRTASDRSTRMKRSKLCIKNPSRDSVNYNRDVFGFKPFASKQIIILTTKEGNITCEYEGDRDKGDRIERNEIVSEIIDELFEKVDELTANDLTDKFESGDEKTDGNDDFEVIVYTNPLDDNKCVSPTSDLRTNDLLDTIEENDITDTTASIEAEPEDIIQITNDITDTTASIEAEPEDIIQIINDTTDTTASIEAEPEDIIQIINDIDDDNVVDSDGLVNDKLLSSAMVGDANDKYVDNSDVNDSSINRELSEALTSVMSGDRGTDSEPPRTPLSFSDSKSTLRLPSNEEISIESLLNYLRRRNAAYGNSPDVADVD